MFTIHHGPDFDTDLALRCPDCGAAPGQDCQDGCLAAVTDEAFDDVLDPCDVITGIPGMCGFDHRDTDLWGTPSCPTHGPQQVTV